MIDSICLDTRILSRFLNGNQAARNLILEWQENGFEVYTTMVNVTEIFNGLLKISRLSDQKRAELDSLFATLHPRELDYATAVKAGELAAMQLQGLDIGWRDLFMAAIVSCNGNRIITSNVEHFKRVPGIDVIEYS
jgi:predicted nucleic acid-binding protein